MNGPVIRRNFVLNGYTLRISPEMRELVRDKPDMALAEAFKAGRYHGQQEANNAWAAEANRKGGAVRWNRWTRKILPYKKRGVTVVKR